MEKNTDAFVSFIQPMTASPFSFKWKSIMRCDIKLSLEEHKTQVALFVLIQRRELSRGKVEEEGDLLLFDSISFVAS